MQRRDLLGTQKVHQRFVSYPHGAVTEAGSTKFALAYEIADCHAMNPQKGSDFIYCVCRFGQRHDWKHFVVMCSHYHIISRNQQGDNLSDVSRSLRLTLPDERFDLSRQTNLEQRGDPGWQNIGRKLRNSSFCPDG